jgi:hypothetical protein
VRRPGTTDDGSNLPEGHAERVAQHEREPLGRRERLEHREERETDRVGQQRFVFRVDLGFAAHDRLGHAQGLLAPGPARAQHVQAHPTYDRRKPSAQVLDPAGVRAAEPQPGLLHGVVGLA